MPRGARPPSAIFAPSPNCGGGIDSTSSLSRSICGSLNSELGVDSSVNGAVGISEPRGRSTLRLGVAIAPSPTWCDLDATAEHRRRPMMGVAGNGAQRARKIPKLYAAAFLLFCRPIEEKPICVRRRESWRADSAESADVVDAKLKSGRKPAHNTTRLSSRQNLAQQLQPDWRRRRWRRYKAANARSVRRLFFASSTIQVRLKIRRCHSKTRTLLICSSNEAFCNECRGANERKNADNAQVAKQKKTQTPTKSAFASTTSLTSLGSCSAAVALKRGLSSKLRNLRPSLRRNASKATSRSKDDLRAPSRNGGSSGERRRADGGVAAAAAAALRSLPLNARHFQLSPPPPRSPLACRCAAATPS